MLQLNRCHKISPETGIRAVLPEETLKRAVPLLEKAGMHALCTLAVIPTIGR